MDVLDVNVLLYAHHPAYAEHTACREWLKEAIASGETLGLCAMALSGFVRISLNRKAFASPEPLDRVLAAAEGYLRIPTARRLEPGPGHWEHMTDLLRAIRGGHNDVTDAYLAALAIENDATLVTADRGFARFPGLRVLDPVSKGRSRGR